MRIANTVNDSIVDGHGLRFTIFTQGCPHHCPAVTIRTPTIPPAAGRFPWKNWWRRWGAIPSLRRDPLRGEPFAQAADCAALAQAPMPGAECLDLFRLPF